MKKTHKVVMLSTEKESPIWLSNRNTLSSAKKEGDGFIISHPKLGKNQHLYIISDEETKEGDWIIGIDPISKGILCQVKKDEKIGNCYKKVIASTDKSLKLKCISCNGTGEKNESHESNSPYDKPCSSCYSGYNTISQIPESFIQAYIKSYNEGNPITEVDLEYESYNEEYKDKFGTDYSDWTPKKYKLKTREDNTVIIHQSKIYTRDEVIELCGKEWDESLAVNKHGKDKLTSDNYTTEPVHFNKFITDHLW